jgi:hypothetical protein
MFKILLISSLIINIRVKCDVNFGTKTLVQNNQNNFQTIGNTNLKTGTYYYIREKSGKYLRWDGNNDLTFGGLYFDPELKKNYQNIWYLFDLEISDVQSVNNIVRIRNLITGSVILNLFLNNKQSIGKPRGKSLFE